MSAGTVFFAGILGVFIGMAVIYLSIKAIELAADRLFDNKDKTGVQ